MKFSIDNLIGISVDEGYKWHNSLFVNIEGISRKELDYENCEKRILIKYTTDIFISDCREISKNIWCGEGILVDKEYGVRITTTNGNFILEVNQECNEWLVICIQVLLVKLKCSFLHAAALEKNGEAVLLPSWGGVGKTATVARMVNEDDWNLLGDDLVIIKEDGTVSPFLKHFVIYPYHKVLFPQLFKKSSGQVSNLYINKVLGKLIPIVKSALRHFPSILSFARKHNPQSRRIPPEDIFLQKNMSKGGRIADVVWLDKAITSDVIFSSISLDKISSTATSVTLMEIFAERAQQMLAFCGCNVMSFENIYIDTFKVINSAMSCSNLYCITIPNDCPIQETSAHILKKIKENCTTE